MAVDKFVDILGDTKDCYDFVSESYLLYGSYVNTIRAIPSVFDGMKAVQRKLVLSYLEAGSKTSATSSASIVGNTIARYHPHGDASLYGALVNMVTAPVPLFDGQGAFGYNGLVTTGAAAMRYTAVKLNDLGYSMFSENLEFVNKQKNDEDVMEPDYLPTPIPYCLLNGTSGIGVGVTTNIPALSTKSILDWVKKYLLNNSVNSLLLPKYDFEKNCEQLKEYNERGIGSLVFLAKVELKENKILVYDFPVYISPTKLLSEFKLELDNQSIRLIETKINGKPAVEIEKAPYVRSITTEEIYKRCLKCMRKSVSFKQVVSDGSKAYIISPRDWLKLTVDQYKSINLKSLHKKIADIDALLLFNKIKHDLAELLLKKKSNEEILDYFHKKKFSNLTMELLISFTRKSISTLRADEISEDKLLKERREYEDNIQNIDNYVFNKIKNLLKDK